MSESDATREKAILQQVVDEEVERFQEEFLARLRLGRKPLPEGEARFERTTIRWKSNELDAIRRAAPGVSISDAIRELALEAAKTRSEST